MAARSLLRCSAFLFALLLAATTLSAETVWIDTDVSIGSPVREADDAFALLLAFRSPELRIAGISTTYGNAPLSFTDQVARDLATRYGKEARVTAGNVYAGAQSRKEINHPSPASDALALATAKGPVTYLALGPLTNLATALHLHPELRERIRRVIFVGGHRPNEELRFGRRQQLRIHDANIWQDPVAAAVVMNSGIPLLLAPISTGRNLLLDQPNFNALRHDGEAGRDLARRSSPWFFFWNRIVGMKGAPIFDALAVVAAVRPDLLTVRSAFATLDHGQLIVNPRPVSGAIRVRSCTGIKPDAIAFVMARLTSSAPAE